MKSRSMGVIFAAVAVAVILGRTATATSYLQTINVDVADPVYSGTAAGPAGLGTLWNDVKGGSIGFGGWPLTNAAGIATGAILKMTANVIGDAPNGPSGPAVNVGATGLNASFKWVQFGNPGLDTFGYQFTNLTASAGGTGKWDLYLYLNTDSGQTAPFTATAGGNTIISTVTPQTTWIDGTSYWVFRDLTPVGGVLNLTAQPTSTTNSGFMWLNGFQLAEQSIPEPSLVALLGLGSLMWLLRRK